MTAFLQRVGHLLGHVILIMLGEHGIGLENAAAIERPFRHHALPFAEQVGQDALIRHGYRVVAVSDLEFDFETVAALQTAVDPAVMRGYEVDITGLFGGRATAVVRPGSADEVAGVLRACRRAGVPVVVQGGCTGLVGGSVPPVARSC